MFPNVMQKELLNLHLQKSNLVLQNLTFQWDNTQVQIRRYQILDDIIMLKYP